MKDRIRQLMEAQHMNQQTFAQFTGIGSASLSSIFTGRTNPTLKHFHAIMEKFPNVNPMWLLNGQGGMFQLGGGISADDTTMASSPENSDGNILGESNSTAGEGRQQTGSQNSSLFDSANMAVQPSLFDNATSAPSQSPSFSDSQISHSSKHTVNGVQMNYSQQKSGYAPQGNFPQQNVIPPTPQRKITEIRIFYDDQTWESFVPKK